MDSSNDDDRVGYGRPPRATRFKPGVSGNPAGRPKGRRRLPADLCDELSEMITISEGGEEISVTKQRAVVKALIAGGLKGDLRAIITLFNLLGRHADDAGGAEDGITAEDSDIIEGFADHEQAADAADQSPPLALPSPSEPVRG